MPGAEAVHHIRSDLRSGLRSAKPPNSVCYQLLDEPGGLAPDTERTPNSDLGLRTAATALTFPTLFAVLRDYSCLPGRTELNTCRTVPRMTPS